MTAFSGSSHYDGSEARASWAAVPFNGGWLPNIGDAGPPPDLTPPVVSNVVPSPGTLPTGTPVSLRITDDEALDSVLILAELGGELGELIYDGSSFTTRYAGSSATPVVGGFDFELVRDGGWESATLVVRILARDASGNEEEEALAYTVTGLPSPDGSPPTVIDLAPSSPGSLPTSSQVTFKVTDAQLDSVLIAAEFGEELGEIVYNGSTFTPRYEDSLASPIVGGMQFELTRSGGWQGPAMTLRVLSRDVVGNVDEEAIVYTVTGLPAPDAGPPVVSNISPAPGSRIARSAPLQFDLVDDKGILVAPVVWVEFPSGIPELAHDGTSFRGLYSSGSSRQLIAGGLRYVLVRRGGWHEAPTVKVAAQDPTGNEV